MSEEFEFVCRCLSIPEAILLRRQGKRPRVAETFGIRPAQAMAAVRVAAELPLGEFRRAQPPFARSRFLLALEVPGPVSAAAAGPRSVLVVGSRQATSRERVRARMLVTQVRTHWENAALREKAYRLAHAAMLGELVLQTAHEISGPLTNVVGCADLLDGRWRGSARAREALGRLKSEADRALEVARGVLSLAHKNGSRQALDWNALVRRALDLRAHALRLAGVDVKTQWSPEPLLVEGNPVRLLHAVLNILVNAEQALERSAFPRRMLVRTERWSGGSLRRARAILEIANNGPPVPPPALPHIFEPFFTTKPPGKGTGLGLSMARDAMTQVRGRIVAENLTPGTLFPEGGVRFRLELPIPRRARAATEPEAQSFPRRRKPGRHSKVKKRRVLVVEDESRLGQLLKEMLRHLGCQVRVHTTAEEALAATAGSHYDLLISDLKLPGRDGSWLFEQLRRRRPDLARRVLFITGDTISPSARSFLRASGRPVLPKPFHLRELSAAVEELLA